MSGRVVPWETWRADYEREFMRKAFMALWFNGISGDYLEFGSCGGMTFTLAYEQSRQVGNHCKLWSFDSFQGLPDPAGAPDEDPRWQKGAMSISLEKFTEICQQHKNPALDYQLVPAYYRNTIGSEDSINARPHDVALAYIDCDSYSSTKIDLPEFPGEKAEERNDNRLRRLLLLFEKCIIG